MDVLERLQEGKITRFPTLKKRIIFQGAIYHITQRAPGKELVFLEDGDYLYFLRLLKEVSSTHLLNLYSFVLMPNHLHLLLQIVETNLSSAMKSLFQRYAQYFNKKYCRKGHVFCGRYRAFLCQDDNYLLAVSQYIHLNPYRAGLCDAPCNYRWSSIQLFVKNVRSSFVHPERILSLLADGSIEKAQKQYADLLAKNMKLKVKTTSSPYAIKANIIKSMNLIRENLGSKKEEPLDILIEQSQKEGGSFGRRKSTSKYLISQLLANGYLPIEIQEKLRISRATYYRIMKK